jgi:hypothetical protein
VSLHFLWRSIGRDGDRAVLQADMVLLSKGLNQCSSLKQGQDSSSNCFLFLKHWNFFSKKGHDVEVTNYRSHQSGFSELLLFIKWLARNKSEYM